MFLLILAHLSPSNKVVTDQYVIVIAHFLTTTKGIKPFETDTYYIKSLSLGNGTSTRLSVVNSPPRSFYLWKSVTRKWFYVIVWFERNAFNFVFSCTELPLSTVNGEHQLSQVDRAAKHLG